MKMGFYIIKIGFVYPNDSELKKVILEEAHSGSFAMHPGIINMYQDLKVSYRWSGMKRHVSEFVTKCLVCQKVKAGDECLKHSDYTRVSLAFSC